MTFYRPWTLDQVPDQDGALFVVTGANSGIGFEAAKVLAARGARVVLACRSLERGETAALAIQREHPDADLELMDLDLASLDSVRSFAERLRERHPRVKVLINNAGVMAIPRGETVDGFERQLGINHLGHFALTGLLLEPLLATPAARVVTVSSHVHHRGKIDRDDLMGERRYGAWRAYMQSKLANLLFAFELDRRFRAAGADAMSVACHPGYAATNLQFVGPRERGSRMMETLMRWGNRLLAENAREGAFPTLYAATGLDIRGGDFVGPSGFRELKGPPIKVRAQRRAYDERQAAWLWRRSEELTGVRYELPSSS